MSPGGFCYLIEYGPPENPQQTLVHPVSELPPQHALVQNKVCGQSFAAGDPIPPEVGLCTPSWRCMVCACAPSLQGLCAGRFAARVGWL